MFRIFTKIFHALILLQNILHQHSHMSNSWSWTCYLLTYPSPEGANCCGNLENRLDWSNSLNSISGNILVRDHWRRSVVPLEFGPNHLRPRDWFNWAGIIFLVRSKSSLTPNDTAQHLSITNCCIRIFLKLDPWHRPLGSCLLSHSLCEYTPAMTARTRLSKL